MYANCHNEDWDGVESALYHSNHNLGYEVGETVLRNPFVKLSSSVTITKIETQNKVGDSLVTRDLIKILYTPPDPTIKICTDSDGNCDNEAVYARVTITLTTDKGTEDRVIEFNKLGLISVEQK